MGRLKLIKYKITSERYFLYNLYKNIRCLIHQPLFIRSKKVVDIPHSFGSKNERYNNI